MSPETVPALPGFAPERVARNKVAHPIPAVGVYMTPDHRYYMNGIGPYPETPEIGAPSVTTVLGILDKPAVVVWKAREAARAMYRAMSSDSTAGPFAMTPSPAPEDAQAVEDMAIKWALAEADKTRDTAASLGSSVHRLADLLGGSETGLEGFQIAEEQIPYVQAFRDFLGRYSASSIVSSEHCVWSANGYAGTYDLLMQLPTACNHELEDGQVHGVPCQELWLIDIKTSKGYYPEYGLQLAGYRWADSIVLPDTPVVYPMPEIQRTGILHLRPDLYPDTGWRLIEYPTDYAKDYMTFLGALEIYKWKEEKRFTKSALAKAQKALKTGSSLPS